MERRRLLVLPGTLDPHMQVLVVAPLRPSAHWSVSTSRGIHVRTGVREGVVRTTSPENGARRAWSWAMSRAPGSAVAKCNPISEHQNLCGRARALAKSEVATLTFGSTGALRL